MKNWFHRMDRDTDFVASVCLMNKYINRTKQNKPEEFRKKFLKIFGLVSTMWDYEMHEVHLIITIASGGENIKYRLMLMFEILTTYSVLL